MAGGIPIQGGSSQAGLANVNTDFQLETNLPIVDTQAGFATNISEVDAGTVTGTRLVRSPEVSGDYRLRTGIDTIWLNEYFPGAAFNTAIWTQPVTTMTATVTGGFARLNAGLSVASAAVARLSSWRSFPVFGSARTYFGASIQFAQLPVADNVCEWGFGIATGTTAPTDGAFFRLNATGEFRAVVNAGGTETQSGTLDFATLVGANTTRTFLVGIGSTDAKFWIDDVLVASIELGASGWAVTSTPELPVLFRNYNSAATSVAQVMAIGAVSVLSEDLAQNKPFGHIMAGAGATAAQGQTGGTMGSTANYANSANPTPAVPTNTTAALGSGLGGQFWETDTLAVTTDGIISSYQVPAGTSALPGKTLYITGVSIKSFVQTVLTGGGYVAQWSLAFGHTAVSLATTDSATGKSPRRIALGLQTVASAAAALTLLGEITLAFGDSPIAVQPGEFIQTVKKKIGTAPSAGVIGHVIAFTGYFE